MNRTFEDIVRSRFTRRGFLATSAVMAFAACTDPSAQTGTTPGASESAAAGGATPTNALRQIKGDPLLAFTAIKPDTTDDITLADGYSYKVLAAWGDPVVPGAPEFKLDAMTKDIQSKTFGYNVDYTCFLPDAAGQSDKGILWINHEYTDPTLMFPGYKEKQPTKEQAEIEIEAHGGSILEVTREADGHFKYDPNGARNRRITGTTPMELVGPVAGTEYVKTNADPSGAKVLGTFNNCGGGHTPWGTILTCEENFDQYFGNYDKATNYSDAQKKDLDSYELKKKSPDRAWETQVERFDMTKEPNEIFRFGYVVEIDPADKNSTPKKHTALGRFKHESATVHKAKNNKCVVYTGDDQVFQFLYKWVSEGTISGDKAKDSELLDKGTLYVAKFSDDGTGKWLPLKFGEGKLVAPDFKDQADVLVRCREAAKQLGATPMDRPEDVEVSPTTGKVYFAMTKNSDRGKDGKPGVDKVNPRKSNKWGHLVEITENGDDHTALEFKWDIPLLCGDPADEKTGAYYAGLDPKLCSPIACVDNLHFDSKGVLWIVTDGQPGAIKAHDGLFAMVVEGEQRGLLKQLMSGVIGSEVTGPFLTPDDKTFFISIQHPGEASKEQPSTLEKPSSQWPDVAKTGTPRPAVITIVHDNGKKTMTEK